MALQGRQKAVCESRPGYVYIATQLMFLDTVVHECIIKMFVREQLVAIYETIMYSII